MNTNKKDLGPYWPFIIMVSALIVLTVLVKMQLTYGYSLKSANKT
jgi:hypothetical protein